MTEATSSTTTASQTTAAQTTSSETAAPVSAVDRMASAYSGTSEASTTAADAGATDAKADDAAAKTDDKAAETGADDKKNSDGKSDTEQNQDGKADTDGQTDDQASEGDKSDDKNQEDEAKEGEEVSSETYLKAIELPEGMEMDKAAVDKAAPILNKHKISAEALKDLSPVLADLVSKPIKEMATQHSQMVEKWHDKTVEVFGKEGEAKFNEKTAVAQTAINKFFDDEGKKALADYGFGNHPAFFALAYAVGSAMADDKPNTGTHTQGQKDETLAEVWYPDANKK